MHDLDSRSARSVHTFLNDLGKKDLKIVQKKIVPHGLDIRIATNFSAEYTTARFGCNDSNKLLSNTLYTVRYRVSKNFSYISARSG
jgi:hypothetical protein